MTNVLVTGMSGTGTSSVLVELGRRGYRVVDTDYDDWCEWVELDDGTQDFVWREDRMTELLRDTTETLFVSGCVANQGKFYDRFDAVVLLSAPREILQTRIKDRATNDYGKRPEEWALILQHLETIEPILRATATSEIVTTKPLVDVADELVAIALNSSTSR
jgi:adenylate kinase family enzyme